MSLPATLFLFGWLIRETFRQALAARTFWLMLSVSLVCILFCLSVHIEGGQSLHRPDELELVGPDNQPLTDPNHDLGRLELAFGAVRLPLFRDAEAQVHFLQTLLAFWVAGVVGTLVTVVWTAGFLPAFLEPSAASVLLAKPVPRWVLLTGKCLGVLTFVAFQEAVFFVGTWLALGVRTGVWPSAYLWCVPLLLLQLVVIYSFSALMAVCTRSTVASIFGAVLFWFCCYAMNYGRHAVVALPYLEATPTPFSARLQELTEVGYWLLPKPADLVILLDQALQAGDHFDVLPRAFRVVQEHGAFAPDLSVLASLLFSVGLLGVAAWQLRTTDY
jgi:ABC-type transport system involved in multi-copper enzyme maturation permease subunit